MKVYLGTDHAGLDIKNKVKIFLEEKGYEVVDCGAYDYDKDDDYPDFIAKAAEGVAKDPGAMGVVLGGSGQGEAIAANKIKGVRAALFYAPYVPATAIDVSGATSEDPYEMLRLTRAHNDTNVLSIGARFLKEEEVYKAVLTWLEAPFSNEERHVRRITKIHALEK